MATAAAGPLPGAPAGSRRRARARLARAFARQRVALAAGVVLLGVLVAGAVVPRVNSAGMLINLSAGLRSLHPTLDGGHIFGTNGIGQDMFALTMYGLRTSEQSAVLGTLLATLIGVVIGGVAGYRGGMLDALLMRLADMLGVFPALLLFLAAYTYFSPVSIREATLILACYLWVPVARVVRAEIVALKEREFVQAALSLGASDARIFFRHLLPNAAGAIVIAATALFGQLIMIEATVDFFGLGVQATATPSLGDLIGNGQRLGLAQGWGWWTWAGPALVLGILLVCSNLVGDGVADALRPNRRR